MKNQTEKDDRMLIASTEDKIEMCRERDILVWTDFLDLRQHSMVMDLCRGYGGLDYEFYGGYDDAEREICVFKPDYIDQPIAEYFRDLPDLDPIAWLRVSKAKGSRELTHRDYLGSLTGLGVKRETTGDILVREDGADIAILREMADFFLTNYFKAGRTEISTELIETKDIVIEPQKFKELRDTVASLRADSVIASGFGLSRSKASEAISRGLVFIDGRQIEKADAQISEGSKVVLRGKGKLKLAEIGNRSKKGRIYIVLQKYI